MFCTGKAGFGISETISLNAFKPFRVDLALPSSIARTQEFTLMAKVLNYLKKCIMVKVTLLEHQGFDMASESSIENQTCVCSMESVIISWHLNATGLGEQNLTVKAESIPSDSLCGNEVAIVPEKGAIDIIRKPLLITMESDEVTSAMFHSISTLMDRNYEVMTDYSLHLDTTDDWDEYGD
ncbi:alpha-2-macroglobulin-like [Scyliorhinus canicula]|uniref:alpha-2-macroglobulin-like n=1 Tax=Scyliorhinus canicula TaxID=7830 RepID=UPI0018F47899|nr:alpha-2-macroglobulin-like [Scyliorhinus canicula]